MMILASSSSSRPQPRKISSERRRVLEKGRIQKLKNWHENVKSIARSEVDFIKSIFRDEDIEDRDWIRDDETRVEESQISRDVVEKDS